MKTYDGQGEVQLDGAPVEVDASVGFIAREPLDSVPLVEMLRRQLAKEGIHTVGEPHDAPAVDRSAVRGRSVEGGNVEVAVMRKGQRVFLGDPKGEGVWFDHVNAQLARVTEESLKRRLSRGWPGTLETLIEAVNKDLHDHVNARRCAREKEEAAIRQATRRQRGPRMRRW